jgi:hypothetical protein
MRGGSLVAIAIALLVCAPVRAVDNSAAKDRMWFVPNPGSLDLLRMFEHPEEWAHARQLVNVFQFTQQHTFRNGDAVVGPNTYGALLGVDAFKKLQAWGIKTALGVGAVKPFYCTPDDSGMTQSISATRAALQAIRDGGGSVAYAAMDEPFLSGRTTVCGGPALDPAADRLQRYMHEVTAAFPETKIGLIEAYPSFTPSDFASMLDLLQARGVLPAFLQLDVDLRAVKPPRFDFARDVKAIRDAAAARGVPFGIILWGYNGDADALFADDVAALANAYRQVFPTWGDVPEQLNIQSWALSSTGLNITPSNLPDNRPYTLTNIFWQSYRRFRGETSGAVTDRAVGRR